MINAKKRRLRKLLSQRGAISANAQRMQQLSLLLLQVPGEELAQYLRDDRQLARLIAECVAFAPQYTKYLRELAALIDLACVRASIALTARADRDEISAEAKGDVIKHIGAVRAENLARPAPLET